MDWIGPLVVACAAFGAAAVTYVLTANLEPQPEYSSYLTDGMRSIGVAITLAGIALGIVMVGYAVLAWLG